mgnify:CR=1 FL=1
MGVTNLGRVQGAGFFYTSVTTRTSVALSTITPTSIKPLVGDCVIFPNGDLRKVTAVSSTTVTCGSVVASLKGAKGDKGDKGDNGTVTSVGVKMNGVVKGIVTESGVIDLGTVITQHQNLPIKSATLSGTTLYLTL